MCDNRLFNDVRRAGLIVFFLLLFFFDFGSFLGGCCRATFQSTPQTTSDFFCTIFDLLRGLNCLINRPIQILAVAVVNKILVVNQLHL
ncbi:TPA: hypothetical protein QEN11_07660 [Stenotrophomonas maltophilia]|nr:hypothetical protein [Stenotrophomonas maltophilia]